MSANEKEPKLHLNRRTIRSIIHGGRRKGKKMVHAPMPRGVISEKIGKIFLPPPKSPTILENLGFTTTAKKKRKKV